MEAQAIDRHRFGFLRPPILSPAAICGDEIIHRSTDSPYNQAAIDGAALLDEPGGHHLAHASDVVSKLFRCKHGKVYLFDKVVNVNVGETDDRMMTTGLHTVCDIFCIGCGSILGWKYVAAFEKS